MLLFFFLFVDKTMKLHDDTLQAMNNINIYLAHDNDCNGANEKRSMDSWRNHKTRFDMHAIILYIR